MTASAQRETPRERVVGPRPDPAAGENPRRTGEWIVAWTLVGLAGALLLTLAGSRLGGGSVTWWFDPRIGADKPTERLIFYAGVALLIVGWLGLGTLARAERMSPRQLSLVAGLWCLPIALGVPLFSRDIYSYLAQGTIAHLGLSPYHAAPAVLGHLGQSHVLSAVDPFWRHVTAPYGPLFLGVISLIVAGTGSHLVAGALAIRAFDLIGFVLLGVFVPRLARRTGADPTRATWLVLASPLVLLQLVAPAHNDLLMAGLMVTGVTLAIERRPLLGIVICALAATIKLPAIIAVAFVALPWIRTESTWQRRLIRGVEAAAATVVTLALVTLVTGFGTGWISSGLFSTPARVRLAITPATDISWTLAKLLGDAGAGASFHGIDSVLRAVLFAGAVIITLVLLERAQGRRVTVYLATALVAFAVAGPALWPWYLTWGLVLLAAWPSAQRSRFLVLAFLLGAILVKPGGILALPLGSSPVIAVIWVGLAILAWFRWRRRGRSAVAGDGQEGLGPARSALAEP